MANISLLATVSSIAVVAGSIWAIFKALEESASPEARNRLAAWLSMRRLDNNVANSLRDILHETYLSFFGMDIFSKKFISRTILISFIVALLSSAIMVLLLFKFIYQRIPDIDSKTMFDQTKFLGAISMELGNGVVLSILALVFGLYLILRISLPIFFTCVIADYLSFAKSMLLLRHAHETGKYLRALTLDILLTVLLAFGWPSLLLGLTLLFNLVPRIAAGEFDIPPSQVAKSSANSTLPTHSSTKTSNPSMPVIPPNSTAAPVPSASREPKQTAAFGSISSVKSSTPSFIINPMYSLAALASTFVPALLLTIIVIAIYLARLLQTIMRPMETFRITALNIHDKPFLVVGYMCAVMSIPITTVVAVIISA